MTDEQLYTRAVHGDDDALGELLERYRSDLTIFLHGYLHNREDAEDVMLDAFAAVVAGGSRFRGKSSFKTWLFAVGRNLALSLRRKNARRTGAQLPSAEPDEGPEDEWLRSERRAMVVRALDTLPEDQRQTLYLQYSEEMSQKEIARVLKKSVAQVNNLAHRGRQQIKTILEEAGFRYEGDR